MLKTTFSSVLLLVVLVAVPCFSITDVPDLYLSEANCAYGGPGTPTLLVVPDGSGPAFTAARDQDGNPVDATITLYLRDSLGVPFVHYPREDLWLASVDNGLVSCSGVVLADEVTDHNGMTWWILPPTAGGFSEENVQVWVAGAPLFSAGINLRFNSPDINWDGIVSLVDVAIFAGDFFGGYQFRSDFHRDGILNLADIAILAQSLGAQCP